jgi:hypothetical protein
MDCQNPPFSGQQAAATAICRIALLSPPSRVIHVIAVITAKGENMKSTIEQTETAPAAATNETKATKKAAAGARRANVAPTKAKLGKKATPKKKVPRSARNDVREGSKTALILDLLKRPGGAAAKGAAQSHRLAAAFPSRLHQRDAGQEDGADRHVHQGRGRGAQLFRQSLIY